MRRSIEALKTWIETLLFVRLGRGPCQPQPTEEFLASWEELKGASFSESGLFVEIRKDEAKPMLFVRAECDQPECEGATNSDDWTDVQAPDGGGHLSKDQAVKLAEGVEIVNRIVLPPAVHCDEVVSDLMTELVLPLALPIMLGCTALMLLVVYLFWVSQQDPKFLKAIGVVLFCAVVMPGCCLSLVWSLDTDVVAGVAFFAMALTQCLLCYLDALHQMDRPVAVGTLVQLESDTTIREVISRNVWLIEERKPNRLEVAYSIDGGKLVRAYPDSELRFVIQPKYQCVACNLPCCNVKSGEVRSLQHADNVMKSLFCLCAQAALCATASGLICGNTWVSDAVSDIEQPEPGFAVSLWAGLVAASLALLICDGVTFVVLFLTGQRLPLSQAPENVRAIALKESDAMDLRVQPWKWWRRRVVRRKK